MTAPSAKPRCVAQLERLATSGRGVAAFQAEALRQLRSLITIDAALFATVDPETLLFTGASSEEPLGIAAAALFLEHEYGRDDVNKFTSLANGADPASSLDMATRGDRVDSARFREVMAPLGLGDELRVALRSRGRCWGVLCLASRRGRRPGSTTTRSALVRRIAPILAEGIRRGIAIAATSAEVDAAVRRRGGGARTSIYLGGVDQRAGRAVIGSTTSSVSGRAISTCPCP